MRQSPDAKARDRERRADATRKLADLEEAVHAAAAKVSLNAPPLADGTGYRLRWGSQVDCRTITDTAPPNGHNPVITDPKQIAAYTAKYLTKTTDDFGLPVRVFSANHAAHVGASAHAVRLIETAEHIAETGGESYQRLLANLAILGCCGHPMTKSQRYSVTFGQIRRAPHPTPTRPPSIPRPTSASCSTSTTCPRASNASRPVSSPVSATSTCPPRPPPWNRPHAPAADSTGGQAAPRARPT